MPDTATPDLTPAQAERLAAIEAATPAPESFDATAACRRVLDFATAHERGDIGDPGPGVVAWMIRVAVHDTTDVAVTTEDAR